MPGSTAQTWADIGVWVVSTMVKMVISKQDTHYLLFWISNSDLGMYHGDILMAHTREIEDAHEPLHFGCWGMHSHFRSDGFIRLQRIMGVSQASWDCDQCQAWLT
jgi:hypothetical protein